MPHWSEELPPHWSDRIEPTPGPAERAAAAAAPPRAPERAPEPLLLVMDDDDLCDCTHARSEHVVLFRAGVVCDHEGCGCTAFQHEDEVPA